MKKMNILLSALLLMFLSNTCNAQTAFTKCFSKTAPVNGGIANSGYYPHPIMQNQEVANKIASDLCSILEYYSNGIDNQQFNYVSSNYQVLCDDDDYLSLYLVVHYTTNYYLTAWDHDPFYDKAYFRVYSKKTGNRLSIDDIMQKPTLMEFKNRLFSGYYPLSKISVKYDATQHGDEVLPFEKKEYSANIDIDSLSANLRYISDNFVVDNEHNIRVLYNSRMLKQVSVFEEFTVVKVINESAASAKLHAMNQLCAKLLKEAVALQDSNQHARAVEKFSQVLEVNPQNIEAKYKRGKSYFKLYSDSGNDARIAYRAYADLEDVVNEYKRLNKTPKEIAIALYFKSRAEYYIGDYSACIRDLNEFEALGFNAPQAYELKANAYIGLNDYASAKKYQKLALKSEADYVKQKTNNVNRPVNNGRQNSGQYDTSTNYYRSGSRGIQKR